MLILVGLVGLVAEVATHLLVFIFVSKRRQMTAQALAGNVWELPLLFALCGSLLLFVALWCWLTGRRLRGLYKRMPCGSSEHDASLGDSAEGTCCQLGSYLSATVQHHATSRNTMQHHATSCNATQLLQMLKWLPRQLFTTPNSWGLCLDNSKSRSALWCEYSERLSIPGACQSSFSYHAVFSFIHFIPLSFLAAKWCDCQKCHQSWRSHCSNSLALARVVERRLMQSWWHKCLAHSCPMSSEFQLSNLIVNSLQLIESDWRILGI